jgi:hypothetical protein
MHASLSLSVYYDLYDLSRQLEDSHPLQASKAATWCSPQINHNFAKLTANPTNLTSKICGFIMSLVWYLVHQVCELTKVWTVYFYVYAWTKGRQNRNRAKLCKSSLSEQFFCTPLESKRTISVETDYVSLFNNVAESCGYSFTLHFEFSRQTHTQHSK